MKKNRREEIEIMTKEIRNNFGAESDALLDVVELAESNGFIVGTVFMDEDEDGFIVINESENSNKIKVLGIEAEKIIGVNAKHDIKWKRFIIAHELGHYFLHYDESKNMGLYAHRDHNSLEKNESEQEADYFAAALLMPRESFINKFEELKEKQLGESDIITILSDKYNCEKVAVKRRIGEVNGF